MKGGVISNNLRSHVGNNKNKDLIMKTIIGKPGYQKFEVKENGGITLETDSLEEAISTFNSLY